jgi:serine/threonine protein kinase
LSDHLTLRWWSCAQGAGIPLLLAGLCIIVALIVAMLMVLRQGKRRREEWYVDWSEIELGESIGMGGYGEVYRAKWRGTEVAVKLVAPGMAVTKEMQKNFADEVYVMTTLRHPNVVLFMAASTKPPKMCIVMEFMALGSLYEVRPVLRLRSLSSIQLIACVCACVCRVSCVSMVGWCSCCITS